MMLNPSKLQHVAVKGSGYFCTVKKFKDGEGNEFALKELKKKFITNKDYNLRFSREIHLLKELQGNKYIVPLINYNKQKSPFWYLMPFAQASLHEYIKRNHTKLSKRSKFKIVSQILNAISYAHSKDILHRDLSPNNILIYEENGKIIAKVCDFGLGKDQKSLSYYTKSSISGFGQLWYVSPEQRSKLKDASKRSDIYSLGKIIYFVFTGKDPSALQSFELSSLVWKASDENPDNRYKNVEELKRHFKVLKKIELDGRIPDQYITLKDLLASDDEFTWDEFHKLVLEARSLDHVYTDFLDPVFQILKDKQSLQDYRDEIGPGIVEGFEKISDNLLRCFKTTGWPFQETNRFAKVLSIAMDVYTDHRIRLICLKLLWHMAYVVDQYAAQRIVRNSFTSKLIAPEIQTPLAEYIIATKADITPEIVASIVDLPIKIKSAILKSIS